MSQYLLILWTNKQPGIVKTTPAAALSCFAATQFGSVAVALEFQRAIRMAEWLPGHNKAHSRVPNIRIQYLKDATDKRYNTSLS